MRKLSLREVIQHDEVQLRPNHVYSLQKTALEEMRVKIKKSKCRGRGLGKNDAIFLLEG